MIYFVQPTDGGPVKIGTTENLPARLKQLELVCERELAVLAVCEGGRKEEAELHDRFSHLRLGRSEQFRPDMELMEFIGCPLFASAGDVVKMPTTPKPLNYDDLRPGRPVAAQFRGSPEFKEWMTALSSYNRASVSQTIEQALIHYARAIGFTEPPPER